MRDQRITKMAQVLVNYSVNVKKNDKVIISASYIAKPLIEAIYEEILKSGGHPILRIGVPGLKERFYEHAEKFQLEYVCEFEKNELETVDCIINIISDKNTKCLHNVSNEKQAIERMAKRHLSDTFMQRVGREELRAVITLFPTDGLAQAAGMSTRTYEEFVMTSCFLNDIDPRSSWEKLSLWQAKICDFLNKKEIIHIKSAGTDIKFNVKGRTWINCDGKMNFPDGEVFTGPHEDYTHGHITFSYPACYYGKEVLDVKLWFEKGKIVKYEASENIEFLKKMLEIDEGAKIVGELAIGTNLGVQKFTRNVLFDEKIGGTIHVAVGQSIPQSGGKNRSAIHWDMINNMRENGEILADGELIQKDGQFRIDF
ncbi:aminopeptidase [bacterium]|nr:aminopeptidase [bacterium]